MSIWSHRKHKDMDNLPLLTHEDVDTLTKAEGFTFTIVCTGDFSNCPYARLHDLGHWASVSKLLQQKTLEAYGGYVPNAIPNTSQRYRYDSAEIIGESLACAWAILKLDEIGRRLPRWGEAKESGYKQQWNPDEVFAIAEVYPRLPRQAHPVVNHRKLTKAELINELLSPIRKQVKKRKSSKVSGN